MPHKICPICNVEFNGRTRSVSSYEQVYCSKACSGVARKNRDYTPKNISEPIEKACIICGKTFKTMPPGATSRSYPKYTQVYCSKPCSGRARFRSGEECNELTVAHAAYIAGFLDGEGTVMLYESRGVVALRVTFANCDPIPLEFIKGTTGVGAIITKQHRNLNHRTSLQLAINSSAAYTLIMQIEPYLLIKREQAQLAIDFFERIKEPTLKADRTWQFEYREQMQQMNRRGPR